MIIIENFRNVEKLWMRFEDKKLFQGTEKWKEKYLNKKKNKSFNYNSRKTMYSVTEKKRRNIRFIVTTVSSLKIFIKESDFMMKIW